MSWRSWRKLILPSAGILLAGILIGLALAYPRTITLLLNGEKSTPGAPARLVRGEPLVPARWLADVWGTEIQWEAKTRTLDIQDRAVAGLQRQLEQLLRGVAPKTAPEAVSLWAEGIKTRNAALQFAALSPELQESSRAGFTAAGWITGPPSPWVQGFTINEKPQSNPDGTRDFRVEFRLGAADGDAGTETWRLTAGKAPQANQEHLCLTALRFLGANAPGDTWQTVTLPEFGVLVRFPRAWSTRQEAKDLRWVDGEGNELGGIDVLGGLYLPNHSLTESEETLVSGIGEAKLFVLKCSPPAASGRRETWTEVHGFVCVRHPDRWLDLWLRPRPTQEGRQARETMRRILENMGPP